MGGLRKNFQCGHCPAGDEDLALDLLALAYPIKCECDRK